MECSLFDFECDASIVHEMKPIPVKAVVEETYEEPENTVTLFDEYQRIDKKKTSQHVYDTVLSVMKKSKQELTVAEIHDRCEFFVDNNIKFTRRALYKLEAECLIRQTEGKICSLSGRDCLAYQLVIGEKKEGISHILEMCLKYRKDTGYMPGDYLS